MTWRTVRPSRSQSRGDRRRRSSARLGEQARSADGHCRALDLRPGAAAGQRLEAGRGRDARAREPARPSTIARASGCSESASTAAASRQSASALAADVDEDRLALGQRAGLVEDDGVAPSRARSSASRSLTSRPFRAPSEVEIAITSGIASPRACGQAITRTVAVRTSAPSGSPCEPPEDERDRCRPRGRRRTGWPRPGRPAPGRATPDAWAAATSRMIPDSAVSSPMAVTWTRRRAARGDRAGDDRVAGLPWRPARDSPVIIDSSTSALPSTTMPSAGTRAPGRTRTTSPTASAATGTVLGAVAGRRARPCPAAARPGPPGRRAPGRSSASRASGRAA